MSTLEVYAHSFPLLLELRILDRTSHIGVQARVNETPNFIYCLFQIFFKLDADHIFLSQVRWSLLAGLLVVQQVVSQDDLFRTKLVRRLENLLDEVILFERWSIADFPLRTGSGGELLDGSVPVKEVRMSVAVGDFWVMETAT